MNTWFLLKGGQSCSVLSVPWIVLPLKSLPSSLSAENRRFRWGIKNPEVHFAFLTRRLAAPEFRNAIMFLSSITWVSSLGWAASLETSQTNFLCGSFPTCVPAGVPREAGRGHISIRELFHCCSALPVRIFQLTLLTQDLGVSPRSAAVFLLSFLLLFAPRDEFPGWLVAALLCHLEARCLWNKICLDSTLFWWSPKGACRTLIRSFPEVPGGWCDIIAGMLSVKTQNPTKYRFFWSWECMGAHICLLFLIHVLEVIKCSKHSFKPYREANFHDLTETQTISLIFTEWGWKHENLPI